MNGVQCYELFGEIALKNHVFFHGVLMQKTLLDSTTWLTPLSPVSNYIVVITYVMSHLILIDFTL